MILFTHIAWLHIRSVVTIVSRNCVVAYVHIHIHTYIHTDIHTYIYTYTYIHTRMHAQKHVHMWEYELIVVETKGASTLVLP